MNEQELKNLIVAKDLEIYKLRTELALAQKQVKELTSYLDQVTTPVKDEVTPEPVQNEKKSKQKTYTKKMNLSPADYIEQLAEEALNTSREIADLVK